ncbi:MAG: amino acid ABC transporter ATP-binding protein [Cellulosilyticaceae bacterium]
MKINIQNLAKSYDNQHILAIDELLIDEIHALALIGPSGGGKSTLLKILGTIEDTQATTLMLNDINLLDTAQHARYLKEIGYVFQSNNLFPHLSVLENITLPLVHSYGLTPLEATKRAEYWLDHTGILEHKHKKPSQISGGQAQRAAIVRSLVAGTSVLMLDEPTSALDPKLAYEVMQTLLTIKENSDVILVTHELNFARKFADYYLFIDDGKILSHGPMETLFTNTDPIIADFVSMVSFKG